MAELRHWNHFQLVGLYPQAERARERLAAHLDKSDRLASRFEAKRMRAASSRVRVGIRAANDVSAAAGT